MAHLTFAKIEIRKMNQKLLLIIQIRGMRLIKNPKYILEKIHLNDGLMRKKHWQKQEKGMMEKFHQNW